MRGNSGRSGSVNLDQARARVELTHDLGPKPLEGGDQGGGAAVADAQPNDPHAFGTQDRQLRKILVFGDDYRPGLRRVLPDQRVGRLPHAEGKDMLGLVSPRLQPVRECGGQLIIDQEARHEAAA